jgi:hypothetical protein
LGSGSRELQLTTASKQRNEQSKQTILVSSTGSTISALNNVRYRRPELSLSFLLEIGNVGVKPAMKQNYGRADAPVISTLTLQSLSAETGSIA